MKQYILVNLLPYREIERREQKKQLGILSAFAVIVGVFIVFLIAGFYSARIENQEDRNKFLTEENKKLETQIVKIKDLKDKLKTVLARKSVVEDLQITRADGVNLLNTIVQKMPDAVYLKSLKQNGNKITLVGVTQSNAKVSGFMRALEDSNFSTNPQLIEIKAIVQSVQAQNQRAAKAISTLTAVNDKDALSEFTITFDILRKQDTEPKTTKEKKAARAKETKEKNNTKTRAVSAATNNK